MAGLPAEQTLLSILLMAGKVFPSEKHTYKGHEGEHGAKVRSLSHELCVDPDSAVPTRLKCIPDHVAEVTGVLKGLPRDWYKNPVKQYPLLGEAVVETAAAGEVSAEDEEEDEDEDEGQEEDEQGDKEGDKEEGGEEEEDEEGDKEDAMADEEQAVRVRQQAPAVAGSQLSSSASQAQAAPKRSTSSRVPLPASSAPWSAPALASAPASSIKVPAGSRPLAAAAASSSDGAVRSQSELGMSSTLSTDAGVSVWAARARGRARGDRWGRQNGAPRLCGPTPRVRVGAFFDS